MKSICVCVGLHLPYHLKWYLPSEGYTYPKFETYFDEERIYYDFQRMINNIGRTNWILNRSIEKGAAYTLHISGTFFDQCMSDLKILDSFKALANTQKVSFAASPYYHSLSALYNDSVDFKLQVKKHIEKIKLLFNIESTTFINPQLLTCSNVNHILKDLNLRCVIAEGSKNIIDNTPSKIYGNMPTLLRNIELSDDINKLFSNRSWKNYPLTADKLVSWIEQIEGDVITLYIDYGVIAWNEDNTGSMFQFLIDLPIRLADKGINMILPEEAVKKFKPEKLSTLDTELAARHGMNSILGNHAQHFYLRQLMIMSEEFRKAKVSDESIHNIFGYLQQSDIFLDMDHTHQIMGYERAVNNLAILSDFRRAILEIRT